MSPQSRELGRPHVLLGAVSAKLALASGPARKTPHREAKTRHRSYRHSDTDSEASAASKASDEYEWQEPLYPPAVENESSDDEKIVFRKRRPNTITLSHSDAENEDSASEGRYVKEQAPHPIPSTISYTPHKDRHTLFPRKRVPLAPSPFREHQKEFWSEQVTAEWVKMHLPSPPPIFAPPAQRKEFDTGKRREFMRRREELAADFVKQVDDTVFHSRLAELTSSTGGISILWSKQLQTTAGRATWCKEKESRHDMEQVAIGSTKMRHRAKIELSVKVVDDIEKLRNSVAHEMCHLGVWILDGVTKPSHGSHFRAWAQKCNSLLHNRGVHVTVTHDYQISYKYAWTCTNPLCGHIYERHSKSIVPDKHACGTCKCKIEQTRPRPKANAPATNPFSTYIKQNMKRVKEGNQGSPHKEVMAILATEYRARKAVQLDLPMSLDDVFADLTL